MPRNDLGEHTCITYSQTLNTINPQFRIHNASIFPLRHPTCTCRVINRLHSNFDDFFQFNIRLRRKFMVVIRASEGVVQIRRNWVRMGDLAECSEAANELLEVVWVAQISRIHFGVPKRIV